MSVMVIDTNLGVSSGVAEFSSFVGTGIVSVVPTIASAGSIKRKCLSLFGPYGTSCTVPGFIFSVTVRDTVCGSARTTDSESAPSSTLRWSNNARKRAFSCSSSASSVFKRFMVRPPPAVSDKLAIR